MEESTFLATVMRTVSVAVLESLFPCAQWTQSISIERHFDSTMFERNQHKESMPYWQPHLLALLEDIIHDCNSCECNTCECSSLTTLLRVLPDFGCSPNDVTAVGSIALCAPSIFQRSRLPKLQRQNASLSYHRSVVDAVPVIHGAQFGLISISASCCSVIILFQ